jgi:hypothetical protein
MDLDELKAKQREVDSALLAPIDVGSLVTTLRGSSIGSSFTKGDKYFVSTVGDHSLRRYETIIKVAGISGPEISRVISDDPLSAVMTHIAMTRMAISTDRAHWSSAVADSFIPTKIKEFLDKQVQSQDIGSFKDEYPALLLRMSGVGFQPSGKPSAFHLAAYLAALVIGGRYGWQYGYDVGGILLGVVLAAGGAVIGSTLVGLIAHLFGYSL